jgi:hypothetical protein
VIFVSRDTSTHCFEFGQSVSRGITQQLATQKSMFS